MIRFLIFYLLCTLVCFGCNNDNKKVSSTSAQEGTPEKSSANAGKLHFEGSISNGMKGDRLSFDISVNGKKLSNLTFIGYWRCSGTLESITAGPKGDFTIIDKKVNDHISEPPNGGSTAWRYDLVADIKGNTATGSFRMNINNLGCDTYKLLWTATGN